MTDTATLITQLRVLAHLTRTEAQVARLRTAQATGDGARDELTRNAADADVRAARITEVLHDLGAPDAPRTAIGQLRRVRHWLAQAPGPVRLLVGDLNLPWRLPALVAGGQQLVRGATYPANRPRLQLDHVLALQGEVVGEEVELEQPLGVGDHRPVLVDVRSSTPR